MGKRGRGLGLGTLAGALLVLALGAMPQTSERAEACAFLRVPHAYEADQARTTYANTMNAAAVDALFPGDPIFGLPPIETGARSARAPGGKALPPSLLRSIGWVESTLSMAARAVPFQSTGPALVSFDCGHGVMQVTTGMTVPLGVNNQPTPSQASIATHYAYNIARGAVILAEKWNQAPELRPVAGADTGSNPLLIENWYFAVWSYNGFTGPGSTQSNHPLDPVFTNPRAEWRCDGSQSRTRYPYQELVWGCLNNPPSSGGIRLWAPVAATLPNLSLPQFFQPLAIANFAFPYPAMDIPTPQPAHADPAAPVTPDFRARVLGSPVPAVSGPPIELRLDTGPAASRATVQVRNGGTGILVWSATPSASWIVIDPPAGAAVGPDVACGAAGGCAAASAITVTVNPVLLPQSAASGSITITGANGSSAGPSVTVAVTVNAEFDTGAPGVSRAY